MNKDLNANDDEQGEGWGDDKIELPPDLVSLTIFSFESILILFLFIYRKELVLVVEVKMKMMQVDTLLLQPKVNPYHKHGYKIRNYQLIMF